MRKGGGEGRGGVDKLDKGRKRDENEEEGRGEF